MTPDPFDAASDYNVPKGDSSFLKLEKGETEFLPLASPVIGWEYWNVQNKPVRIADCPDNPALLPGIRAEKSDDGSVKYKVSHFWAFPVIECSTGKVKLLEITQKSIQNDIRAYAKNARWGSPVMRYTFTVNREGDKFDTKYTVMANPLAEIPATWGMAWDDARKRGFNLQSWFNGGELYAAAGATVVVPEPVQEQHPPAETVVPDVVDEEHPVDNEQPTD